MTSCCTTTSPSCTISTGREDDLRDGADGARAPHGDSKFPRAVESFLRLPISEASKRRILWDNCAAYYGLPA